MMVTGDVPRIWVRFLSFWYINGSLFPTARYSNGSAFYNSQVYEWVPIFAARYSNGSMFNYDQVFVWVGKLTSGCSNGPSNGCILCCKSDRKKECTGGIIKHGLKQ